MQQVDDPPYLLVGTEVSAKYKGAFCEAKVSKVVRNIKVKVAYKQGLGSGIVSDDEIKATPGQLRVGAVVEVRHPERKDYVEATITKVQDCSQYTVVFDDGDITTLRRTALCLKSGRHFNESETLDQLPLTHPEHFGNPVVGGRRGRRRGHLNEDSSDDGDESDTKEVVNEKEEHIGKVVCVETESKKKDKEKWFPALVVAPTAQATVRIRVKDEYLVRSFKDGRYYTVPKKEATEFTREAAAKQDGPAVQAALEYLDNDILPPHWDRDSLFGLSNSSSENEDEVDSDSSDDEPREEKDRFVAQLYKYMDDRGTPLNKVPSIQNRDVDLYRLFRAVQKRGGYNRVTAQNQWKSIAIRLGFTPVSISITNLVKQAYKKFLQPYGEFHRKLGCSMLMSPRNSNRSKGRSLVRANSVASPKLADPNKEVPATTSKLVTASPYSASTSSNTSSNPASTAATLSTTTTTTTITISTPVPTVIAATVASEESEDTSESSQDAGKNNKRKSLPVGNTGKVKSIVEKYEEKLLKDDGDVPLSKMKAAAALKDNIESKEKEKEKDKDSGGSKECSSGHVTRDSSPAGPTVNTGKKEKHQRKQLSQSDEKRGKRKKDENIVEKIDTGDFIIETGDKLKVYYHEKRVTYEAKVIEIAVQRGTPMYLVHYTGWNNRYDEWVPRERIAENLTKGLKQKGRSSSTGSVGTEKNKENPPKPPTTGTTSMVSSTSSSTCSLGATTPMTKAPAGSTGGKRGRGRSDSMPPRSSTPSSVASNSSRTKSPATSSAAKKRPQRQIPNTNRRVSAVSDVSLPTEESDTDSDEPVRRPTRGMKANIYNKATVKTKASTSPPNSQTDTDDNDDDADAGTPTTSKTLSRKSGHLDLKQVCSELKGLQNLKALSEINVTTEVKADYKDSSPVKVKNEKSDNELKTSTQSTTNATMLNTNIKDSSNLVPKEEISKKTSTEVSSGSESCGDDDSQSSDKTTQLENMTKKFQQIINADKQRALDKTAPTAATTPTNKANVPLSSSKIVEKIIKDRENEKRQESLKTKPLAAKEELKAVVSAAVSIKSESLVKAVESPICKDEDKKLMTSNDSKVGIIASTRFGTSSNANITKYTSVIVEKAGTVAKKSENPVYSRKADTSKKIIQPGETSPQTSKKFIEPTIHKEILKVEPPAACSPSSISSISSVSSTHSSTSSATSTSRSLPDMSKLDISGSSSMVSSCSGGSSASYANTIKEVNTAKPNSPDVYEFKDPEPFEFEMRKSSLAGPTCSTTSVITANLGTINFASTSNILRNKSTPKVEHPNVANPVSTVGGRKKRGSPMKEALKESSIKHLKLEERNISGATPLVADAKLFHHAAACTMGAKSAHSISQSKAATTTAAMMQAPSTPKSASTAHNPATIITNLTSQKSEMTPFDALRKSPNFNLNINALNEELAQTVQETTRALTDAMQAPSTPTCLPSVVEITSSKTTAPAYTALSSPITSGSSKLGTPTSSNTDEIPISIKEDLSNVFGLSFGPGDSATKDNKFEFEDAKKLLSATVEAFDLDPTKFETKPTPSIADKVLKAISQKKEEEESKKQEAISREKDSTSAETKEKESTPILNTLMANALPKSLVKSGDESKPIFLGALSSTATNLLSEPLKINTELPGMSASLLSGTLGSFLSAKRITPPLTSPDGKIGLLESIGTKTQLTETIQKLECAIQRRTPVTSHSVTPTTPLSVTAPETYSEESNDSTDSERRLVIEDVIEETTSTHPEQKASPLLVRPEPTKPVTPVKLEILTIPINQDVATLSPIKVATTTTISNRTSSIPAVTTTIPETTNQSHVITAPAISTRLVSKLAASAPALVYQQNTNKSVITSTMASMGSLAPPVLQKAPVILPSGIHQQLSTALTPDRMATDLVGGGNFVRQTNIPGSTTIKTIGTAHTVPTTSTVVPIELPDIPASVVVASSAIPSVMAAAHAAAAALQTPKSTVTKKQMPTVSIMSSSGQHQSSIQISPIRMNLTAAAIHSIATTLAQTPQTTTSPMSSDKPFDNLHTISVRAISSPLRPHSNLAQQTNTNKAIYQTIPVVTGGHTLSPLSTSGFYLDPRTDLRPDDGLKPLIDVQQQQQQQKQQHQQQKHIDKDKPSVVPLNSPATIIAQSSTSKEVPPAHYVTLEQCTNITDHHNDAINQLLCEETIPGSPASVITGREDSQERTATCMTHEGGGSGSAGDNKDFSNLDSNIPSGGAIIPTTANSSPNDSVSQEDESSEDLKKVAEQENEEIMTRKRRRARKQGDNVSVTSGEQLPLQQQQQQHQQQQLQTKRRRTKKNTTGSDSDDNSDAMSQRQQQQLLQQQLQQQQQQQQQLQHQLQAQNTAAPGSKPCPYNFLVQLDPSLSPDQCIAILLKQIQDLRKTYNIIKSDLASIDRRRKKLRRREREKKQQLQNQQQMKINS